MTPQIAVYLNSITPAPTGLVEIHYGRVMMHANPPPFDQIIYSWASNEHRDPATCAHDTGSIMAWGYQDAALQCIECGHGELLPRTWTHLHPQESSPHMFFQVTLSFRHDHVAGIVTRM